MNKLSIEKAIEVLYVVRGHYANMTVGYPKSKDFKAIDDVTCSEIANSCLMAIKALKQESVLDKLKEEMYEASHAGEGIETVINLEDALEILDKLITESEK